jgi:hypothetical protein
MSHTAVYRRTRMGHLKLSDPKNMPDEVHRKFLKLYHADQGGAT